MCSHRINQIYPLVSLAVDEFPSDVVLDILSGSIRSLPLSGDLFRLCTSIGVETRQRGARDGSRKATDVCWNNVGDSLHGWLLEVGVYRREGELGSRLVLWGKARSDHHVRVDAYGMTAKVRDSALACSRRCAETV
jgi:hypothetical protein